MDFLSSSVIAALNDKILAAVGSRWDDWHSISGSFGERVNNSTLDIEAARVVAQEFGDAPLIVLKDPRICRLLPFWIPLLAGLSYETIAVIPIRPPLEVARSLKARNDFPIGKSVLLWLRHVLDAEAGTRGLPRIFFTWNEFLIDPHLTLAKLTAAAGIRWPRGSPLVRLEVDRFLSSDLRHQTSDIEEMRIHPDVNPWVRKSFQALNTLTQESRSSEALAELDQVSEEFNRACQAFGRCLVELEDDRSSAVRENQATKTERSAALLERDLAVQERDAAQRERDAAVQERDAAQRERDAAVQERDAVSRARDSLISQREATAHELQSAINECEGLRREVIRREEKDRRRLIRRIKRFFRRLGSG